MSQLHRWLTAAPQDEFKLLTSDDNLAEWAVEYQLNALLLVPKSAEPSEPSMGDLARLFTTYVGAVESQYGGDRVLQWIQQIYSSPIPDSSAPPAPYVHPPPLPPGPQPSHAPAKSGKTFSSMINEYAQQKKRILTFTSECTGPAHQLLWTFHVFGKPLPFLSSFLLVFNSHLEVDGTEIAAGNGSSKQAAKEEACKTTCIAMKWS